MLSAGASESWSRTRTWALPEALSLGSISQIVMPSDLRQVLAEHMEFCLRHYNPEPLHAVQREFH